MKTETLFVALVAVALVGCVKRPPAPSHQLAAEDVEATDQIDAEFKTPMEFFEQLEAFQKSDPSVLANDKRIVIGGITGFSSFYEPDNRSEAYETVVWNSGSESYFGVLCWGKKLYREFHIDNLQNTTITIKGTIFRLSETNNVYLKNCTAEADKPGLSPKPRKTAGTDFSELSSLAEELAAYRKGRNSSLGLGKKIVIRNVIGFESFYDHDNRSAAYQTVRGVDGSEIEVIIYCWGTKVYRELQVDKLNGAKITVRGTIFSIPGNSAVFLKNCTAER